MIQNLFRSRWFFNLLLLFVLIQPLVDVLTSFTLRFSDSQTTIGLIVRFTFMLLGGLYLLVNKEYPYRKGQIVFLCCFVLFLSINIITSYFLKPNFSLVNELKFILKLVYFIVMLFITTSLLKTLPKQQWLEKVIFYLVLAMTIIGGIMLISWLTNTSFNSYRGGKLGHVGWFFAGNEIGAILSIGFPIVVLVALKKSGLYWIPVLLTCYGLFSLGTKVGIATLFLVIGIALLFSLVDFFRTRYTNEKETVRFSNMMGLVFVLIGSIVYTPYSPIAHNMNIHLSILGIDQNSNQSRNNENPDHEQNHIKEELTDEQIDNLIYSGRETFLQQHKAYFKEAPLIQKLFGLGYGGNYQERAKMVEMDFYDLFFSFGYIGSLLFIAPILYLLVMIVTKVLSHFRLFFHCENILIASGIFLGLGIATIAGHVLTAPAVSIYVALLIGYLFAKLDQETIKS